MSAIMPAIPIVDTGEGGPLRHAVLRHARARALRDDCLTIFPRAVTPFLPALDGAARHWLSRSCSPYVPERPAFAGIDDANGWHVGTHGLLITTKLEVIGGANEE